MARVFENPPPSIYYVPEAPATANIETAFHLQLF